MLTGGEWAYLGMVFGGMTIFAFVLAYAAWIAPGDKHH